MQFLVTMHATVKPPARMSIDGLPPFVEQATFSFVITAVDFETAFELSAELADLCPYATTVEVKQLSGDAGL